MSDFELESKLKSVRVPERPDGYWEDFPAQVRAQISGMGILPARLAGSRPHYFPRLAWAGGFAAAVVLAIACVQSRPLRTISLAIEKQQKHFHAQLARFDTGLHKLMLNTGGMDYLLTEPE